MRTIIRKSLRERLQARWGTGVPPCRAPHTPRPKGSTLYKPDVQRYAVHVPPPLPPRTYVSPDVMAAHGWALDQSRDARGRLV